MSALISPEKARALLDAATSGPWRWYGDTSSQIIYLATVDRGRQYVMRFLRWGMRNATPTFTSRDSHMMEKAEHWAQYEVAPTATSKDDPRLYRHDFVGLRHPDAQLMEAAPLLAEAAAEYGRRNEAALALHTGRHYCADEYDAPGPTLFVEGETCPTARALTTTRDEVDS